MLVFDSNRMHFNAMGKSFEKITCLPGAVGPQVAPPASQSMEITESDDEYQTLDEITAGPQKKKAKKTTKTG